MGLRAFIILLGAGIVAYLVGTLIWRVLGQSILSWWYKAETDEGPSGSGPDEPVVIYSGSFIEASQLKDRLQQAGFRAFVWDGTGTSLIPLSLHARVAIGKNDVERAKAVLEAFQEERV